LENILRILHQEIEGLQKEQVENYDEAIDYVENN